MTYSLDITLPGLPPMNSADGYSRWTRRKMRDEWEGNVRWRAFGKGPKAPLSKAFVTITRYSTREPDFENLAQGGKFLLDGLVKCGVLEDDSPRVIGQPTYLWEKASPKHGCVRIQVEGRE